MKITLKAARVNAGYSQKQIAEQFKISQSAVSKWENGQAVPRVDMAMKLSDLYGLDLQQILFAPK